ncbi:hypothetical protein FWK35_00024420 [Aphis craccivora]|uniref:Uncharacterized protein n=1 Tax=Aphis craccivora TaxID=307492 RepID=A0A6G0YC62_APHCR|nr:hypothetical protein FWK35_00024420 [Aphis craccivora]
MVITQKLITVNS